MYLVYMWVLLIDRRLTRGRYRVRAVTRILGAVGGCANGGVKQSLRGFLLHLVNYAVKYALHV